MSLRTRRKTFSSISTLSCCALILLCFASSVYAEGDPNLVLLRDNVSHYQRLQLAGALNKISGSPQLRFDENGALRLGTKDPKVGSSLARELLEKAVKGAGVIILEEASNRSDVAFCSVSSGRWVRDAAQRPAAYVVSIDFADFQNLVGDRRALEAFDVGWAVLHELDHVVNDSEDSTSAGETGGCENNINSMRRELKLPERMEYFYTLFPVRGNGNVFPTRFVRLAFEARDESDKKKRYWVMWDAALVGGVMESKALAVLK
ncbi:MAG: hypothetical protein ACR2HX_16895 [Pyrinomonadaceae bacterium]